MNERLRRLAAEAPFELWLVDLQARFDDRTAALLSAPECERAARFVFERDRYRYKAAHCALRELLSRRTGRHLADVSYAEGPYGKPSLQGSPRCAFNMSHSDDLALIAMAEEGEIGVDVEVWRPMPDAKDLARQNFSAAECAELAATKTDDQSLAFLLGWTRKEACLKAIGSGLSIAPNIFTAGLSMEPRSVGIETPDGIAQVRVHSFRHGPHIVGSLAKLE
jgi:4'-phosphopantetheinyl transferase